MEITTILLIVGGVLFLAVVTYFFTRKRDPKPVEYLNLNCPGCKRKLRYLPRQAGHSGTCPRCNKALRFPGKE